MNDRKQRPLTKDAPGIPGSLSSIGISRTEIVVPDPLELELKYLSTLHENILFKMLKSKWLRSFSIASEGRWNLRWTTEGARRTARLREIIKLYDLTKDFLFPFGFTLLAHDAKMAGNVPSLPKVILDFWRDCCNEVELAASAEACAMFVEILTADESQAGRGPFAKKAAPLSAMKV
jgi:hypothetical protein